LECCSNRRGDFVCNSRIQLLHGGSHDDFEVCPNGCMFGAKWRSHRRIEGRELIVNISYCLGLGDVLSGIRLEVHLFHICFIVIFTLRVGIRVAVLMESLDRRATVTTCSFKRRRNRNGVF